MHGMVIHRSLGEDDYDRHKVESWGVGERNSGAPFLLFKYERPMIQRAGDVQCAVK